jgi:hypothetical protein
MGFREEHAYGGLPQVRSGTPELPDFRILYPQLASQVKILAASFGSSKFGPDMLHTPLEFPPAMIVGPRFVLRSCTVLLYCTHVLH